MDPASGTAVVTGAASGIGLGLVRACVAEGMSVVMSDIDGGRLEEAASALRAEGGSVWAHPCDVRDLSEVHALQRAAAEHGGPVDLLFNNAGVGLARPVPQCSHADWRLLLEVNVQGVINGIQTFLPAMIEQGRGHICSTASLSGLAGDPDLVAYSGTKFAVVGIMEGLAIEMRRDHPGISCSVLCPGPVATDLMATSSKNLVDSGGQPSAEGRRAAEVADYLARGMDPDEVGRLALAGIGAGDFWLLPHPDMTFEILDPRYEAMKRGQLHVDADWVLPR